MPSHYEILGIEKQATLKEITATYRALAKKYHPDHNHDPEATVRFQEVITAFQVLSNDAERRTYDKEITQKTHGLAFSVFNEEKNNLSAQALAVKKDYSFIQIIHSAQLPVTAQLKMAKENEEIALAILADEEIQRYWNDNHRSEVGLQYEKVAVYLITHFMGMFAGNKLDNNFPLLKKFMSATKNFLEQEGLTTGLSGKQLHALVSAHGNFFEMDWNIANRDLLCERLAMFESQERASRASAASASSASVVQSPKPKKSIAHKKNSIGFIEKAKLGISFALLNVSDILQDKNITPIRNFFGEDRQKLREDTLDFIKLAEIAIEDEVLRAKLNGFDLYRLIQKHGVKIKTLCLKHEASFKQYSAYLDILAYHSGSDANPVELFEQAGITQHLAYMTWQSSEFALLYISIFCRIPQLMNDNAVITAIVSHEPVALQGLTAPHLMTFLSNYYVNKEHMNINTPAKCRLVLDCETLYRNLSGADLHEFILLFGHEASDLIFANPALLNRLLAYQVLAKAQAQGKMHLEEKTTVQLGEEDKSELLYQRGLEYLKIKKTQHTAAGYFRQAASEGHEAAFHELLKLSETNNPTYWFWVGELYTNVQNHDANRERAEFWLLKAVQAGEVRAIKLLMDILKNKIFDHIIRAPLTQTSLYNLCVKSLQGSTDQLAQHEKNALWRGLFTLCREALDRSEAITISKFMPDKKAEDYFAIGHLQLDYLTDKCKDEARLSHPDWSEDEIQQHLYSDESRAKRLNVAIPYFIQALNLEADFSLDVLIVFLRELAQTQLANDEVCSLVLAKQEIATHPNLLPQDLFLIVKNHPSILNNNDAALMTVRSIKSSEELYQLAWSCMQQANKITASSFLFLFTAAQLGHEEALRLLEYLAMPLPLNPESSLLRTLHLDIENVENGGLADDEDLLSSPKYRDIIATLVYLFNQTKSYIYPSSLSHLCALVGNLDLLPLDDWSKIDNLDREQQSPLYVLFKYHGAAAVRQWRDAFVQRPETVNAYYLALLNTRAGMESSYRQLQHELINDVVGRLENGQEVHNKILQQSIIHLAKNNDVAGVNFVIKKFDPTIAVGMINGLIEKLFFKVDANRFFVSPVDSAIKDTLEDYRLALMNHWASLIRNILSHLLTHPPQPIFLDNGYQARAIFAGDLRSIKVLAGQANSNGGVDVQIAIHAARFINSLLAEKHLTSVRLIADFFEMPSINSPVDPLVMKKYVSQYFKKCWQDQSIHRDVNVNIRAMVQR